MEDDFPYDFGFFFKWPIVFREKQYEAPDVVPGFSDREEVYQKGFSLLIASRRCQRMQQIGQQHQRLLLRILSTEKVFPPIIVPKWTLQCNRRKHSL